MGESPASAHTGGNDMVPVADRLQYLEAFRFGCILLVLALPLLAPGLAVVSLRDAAMAAGAYGAVSVLASLGWRIRRGRGLLLFGGMLLVDGLFLAWAVQATGGSGSLLRSLVPLHLVVVTLLASYRTGLKMAMWHSMLFLAVFYAADGGMLASVEDGYRALPGTGFERVAAFIGAFWLVTLCTAVFSAVNERELRRRRIDLEALAEMANELEKVNGPARVGQVLVDKVCETFGFKRALLVGGWEEAPVVLGRRGIGPHPKRTAAGGNALIDTVREEKRTLLVKRLDEGANTGLALLLPEAENLVVVPLLAEGRPIGVLVVEHPAERGSRMEQRVLAMVEQFAAHAALALANAWLLVRLKRMADIDSLTAVANRRSFDLTLARAVDRATQRGEPLSLVMVDIDHFKRLNDTYGHQSGDQALRVLAASLAAVCRNIDTLARYGGEEFAVILPASPASAAAVTGERLRRAVAEAPTVVPITASVGIATLPDHASGVGGLLRAADTALYESKQRGRDQVSIFGSDVRPVAATADIVDHT
jgi:two-component system, cell cycle response regulator